VDGYRLPWGDDFEWRTRSAAWHVCLEDDLFKGPEERAAKAASMTDDLPRNDLAGEGL
jgi:hypothetical protein